MKKRRAAESRAPWAKCRVCKCTELEPCNPPCGWVKGQGDICSSCYGVAVYIANWMREVALRPSLAALVREVKRLAND